jgi:hypothetical protein
MGLVLVVRERDLDDVVAQYRLLPEDLRHDVRSNLAILSLMDPHAGMPDPRPHRDRLAEMLARLEDAEGKAS